MGDILSATVWMHFYPHGCETLFVLGMKPDEELLRLHFELSNRTRVELLRTLLRQPLNIAGLSKEHGLTHQSCGKHLSRLIEVNLIDRDPEGLISITDYGMNILHLMEAPMFLSNNREYFSKHTLTGLPSEYIHRIGELNEAEFVDDVMLVFNNIVKMYNDAEEYVYRITDRYLMLTVNGSLRALERGVPQKIIDPTRFPSPPNFDDVLPFEQYWRKGLFEMKHLPCLDVFLAMSEKCVCALSFPDPDGRFAYYGYMSEDIRVHKWCLDLFNHYWGMAESRKDFHWFRKRNEE